MCTVSHSRSIVEIIHLNNRNKFSTLLISNYSNLLDGFDSPRYLLHLFYPETSRSDGCRTSGPPGFEVRFSRYLTTSLVCKATQRFSVLMSTEVEGPVTPVRGESGGYRHSCDRDFRRSLRWSLTVVWVYVSYDGVQVQTLGTCTVPSRLHGGSVHLFGERVVPC